MKLIPVKVAWQVAPSTPNLRLVTTESPCEAKVSFAAFFGLEATSDEGTRPEAIGYQNVQVVDSIYDSALPAVTGKHVYQLLELTFVGAGWARMSVGFSDGDVLDPARYDRSSVLSIPSIQELGGNNWLKAFRLEWARTKMCPDPRVYQVEDSDWLIDVGANRFGLTHFVVAGHDSYIEVLAKSWTCEAKGVLNW